MIVYFSKIKNFHKRMGLSVAEFCRKIEIGRTTYWRWSKGLSSPSTAELHIIAKVLKININEISEIEINSSKEVASTDIWQDATSNYSKVFSDRVENIMKEMKSLISSFNSMAILMSGILENSNIAFYAKDINFKYVIANTAFLKNISYFKKIDVYGKNDYDFFNKSEALINTKQDEDVYFNKKSIINNEQYILGTRKKKWGLVSKTLIFDNSGNKLGVIGLIIDITEKKYNEEIKNILSKALNETSFNIAIRQLEDENFLFITDNYFEVFNRKLSDKKYKADLQAKVDNYVYKEDKELVYNSLNNFYLNNSEKLELVFREFGEHTAYKAKWLYFYAKKFKILNKGCYIRLAKDITEEMDEKEKFSNAYQIINNLENCVTFLVEISEESPQDYKYIFVSENSKKVIGYDTEYFFTTKYPICNLLDKKNHDFFKKELTKILEKSFKYDFMINKKDGTRIYCKFYCKHFYTKNKKWYRVIMITDISDSKLIISDLIDYFSIEYKQKERNRIKQIALNFKKNGADYKLISDSTGLSIEDIEKL